MSRAIAIISFLIVAALLFSATVTAQTQGQAGGGAAAQPGPYGSDPLSFIEDVYTIGLAVGGLLAFAMVVYGGVQYTLAAGNPSSQSDAKDRIKSALVGLLLLLGAVTVLNTINPEIIKGGIAELPTKLPPIPKTEDIVCKEKCAPNQICLYGKCSGMPPCPPPCPNADYLCKPSFDGQTSVCVPRNESIAPECRPGNPTYYCTQNSATGGCMNLCAPPSRCETVTVEGKNRFYCCAPNDKLCPPKG
jgi:hypothetical protein